MGGHWLVVEQPRTGSIMTVSLLPRRPGFMSADQWEFFTAVYGSLDNICRVDSDGNPYVDVDAMDLLVNGVGAPTVVVAWETLKADVDPGSLHSVQPEDGILGWAGFMRSHQEPSPAGLSASQGTDGTTEQLMPGPGGQGRAFLALLQRPGLGSEGAWQAAKGIELIPELQDVSLSQMTGYLTHLVGALRGANVAEAGLDAASTEEPESTPETGAIRPAATVGQCFAQAGLWWVAVFCVALVLLIIGVIVSGGGLAAVAAAIVGILVGSGVWATFGAVVSLVICLGGEVQIGGPSHF